MNKIENQTLALAGILQSAALVDQLASKGTCHSECASASLSSIANTSAKVVDIFTSQTQLSVGMSTLKVVLGKKTKSMQVITFYALSLINLEKKLMKNPALLNTITAEIDTLNKQTFFEITHTNSIARLANLYQSTLGELNPRIMVKGEQVHLSSQRTADHIRALLLSGIRAVSLWRSQGGKTWHLLVNKRKILKTLDTIERSSSSLENLA
ncbi:MAG: high frequency lysogenization protein HflD [Proteobacteria bacterium]|nr:high frequency lysogenization protein HflD [Pseudomonadota bacterium]MCH9749564.1 high frequency lysogenization protein HflD [Pseudomonadota bacterium]